MKRERNIKGIIFDLDGTLLNSRDERVKAWSKAFSRNGIEVPDAELRPLIGLPGEALASRYSENPLKIEKDEEEVFKASLGNIHFFPDVVPTIDWLEATGIQVSIVTSSRRELLNRMKLPVGTVVCIDDVKSGKPDTESYFLAAEKMGVPVENILVVGDSENDMIPCMNAGSVCAFFRDHRNIESGNAHFYLDSIGEVTSLVRRINGGEKRIR